MREFDFIDRLRTLSGVDAVALDLRDDAASFRPPLGKDIILSTDTMQIGVHFREDDTPDTVARRVVGAAVSDLIAKGATPEGCLMNFARHPDWGDAWLEIFVDSFGLSLQRYGLGLWGGDTIDGSGQISLTVIGLIDAGKMVQRRGAQIGDDVYVTGTIGSGFLGLKGLVDDHATDRYLNPAPPLAFAPALIDNATSSLDISDGLAIDLDRICSLNNVAMEIDVAAIPLCPAGQSYLRDHSVADLISGGDDYQIAFTAPQSKRDYFEAKAREAAIRLSRIGRVKAPETKLEACFKTADGAALELSQRGFEHF